MPAMLQTDAREVTDRAGVPAKTGDRPHLCGFCVTGDHRLCPERVRNGSRAKTPYWDCPCSLTGHALGRQPALNREVRRLPASALPPRRAPRAAPVTVPLPGDTPERATGSPATAKAPAPATRQRPAPAPRRPAGRSPGFTFPDGVCSPYGFRAVLLERGLVPADFRPQTCYGWATQAAAGKSTFPVRWYAPDGTETTEPALAKPGVPVEDAITWFRTTNPLAKEKQ